MRDTDPFAGGEPDEERSFITGAGEATMAMRMAKSIQGLMDDATATRAAEIAAINEWYDDQMETLAKRMDYVKGQLCVYIRMRRQDIPDFSIHSPHGDAHIVGETKSIKWVDEDAVMKYVLDQKYDTLYKVKYALDKTKIKKQFKVVGDNIIDATSGEAIPGMAVEPVPEKVVLTLTKPAVAEKVAA